MSRLRLPQLIAPLALGVTLALIASCGKGGGAGDGTKFSGERAMAQVEAIVAFGPRPAGSDALEKLRQYLEAELAAEGWQVERQTFTKTTQLRGKVEFVNLRARFAKGGAPLDWSKGGGMVVVASHYDTKWFEDFEFVGANDGGSSTGALVELAHTLSHGHPDIANRVELVFFDGEEAFGQNITATDGLYGSQYYARATWRPLPASEKPSYGIVLDMIGDKDLLVTPPPNSSEELIALVTTCAKHLGYTKYFTPGRSPLIDDHVPLNTEARFPAIDLIDFTYGAWHKKYDTLDRLSAESLEIVGRLTVEMLVRLLE